MIKILIADDHALLRKGLIRILQDRFVDASIYEASGENDIFPLLRSIQFDFIILDISMPGRGGVDILKDIRSKGLKVPVLILSMHPEEQYAVRVLKSGASGYLNKDSAPELLIEAIETILSGKKFISAIVGQQLAADAFTNSTTIKHELLSDREMQVLVGIASGKATGELAEELSLSVNTISTYRARVLEKLELTSNASIARYAIENRLI
jgi:two-component system, NarL family, invasion response regulator UvrY